MQAQQKFWTKIGIPSGIHVFQKKKKNDIDIEK